MSAQCQNTEQSPPTDVLGWLQQMVTKWSTIREGERLKLKAIERETEEWQDQREVYQAAVDREQRYLGLYQTAHAALEDVVDGRVRDQLDEIREQGMQRLISEVDQRYRAANIARKVRREVTTSEMMAKIDTSNPFITQGLEEATKLYCPYDPLDDLPCPICGRDEPTLEG